MKINQICLSNPYFTKFSTSVLKTELQKYAINKFQKHRELLINNVANYLFNEYDNFCIKVREAYGFLDESYPQPSELKSNHTVTQINNSKKMIVDCLEKFFRAYPEVELTDEKICMFGPEMRQKLITMKEPELNTNVIEDAITAAYSK